MSTDTQVIFYFIAFACFVVAAILSVPPKAWWSVFVAAGLASWVLIPLWTALDAT